MKLAFAAALVFLLPQGDTLALKLEKGSRQTKTLSMTFDLELDEVGMSIGGRGVPEKVLEQFEMTLRFRDEVEVEDEYASVDGERTTELVRHYTKASESKKSHVSFPGSEPKDEDTSLESPLVGHSVAFTWDGKEERYERAWRGEAAEKASLEKLGEAMDFQPLLQKGELEVGATWKLESKQFDEVTMPGGSLSFPRADKDEDNPFGGDLEGEVEARYDGEREVDERNLRVIHLKASLTGKTPEKKDVSGGTTEMVVSFDVEGDYLWDFARGRLASYELAGEATFEAHTTREVVIKEQKLPMVLDLKLVGECKIAGKID